MRASRGISLDVCLPRCVSKIPLPLNQKKKSDRSLAPRKGKRWTGILMGRPNWILISFKLRVADGGAMASPLPTSYSPYSVSASKRSRPMKTVQNPSIELPSKDQLIQLLGVLLVATLVATSVSYIVEYFHRQFMPFCESDGDLQVPPDSCIPCPEHGRCLGGNLECFPGFKKHGRSCKEDTELEKKAQKLADWIQNYACGISAQSLCNGAGNIWFLQDDLIEELNQPELKEQFSLTTDEIPFVKEKALEIIRSLFETKKTFEGLEEYKCPDWLAQKYKPFECHTRELIYKHYLFLFIGFPLVLWFTKVLRGIHLQKQMTARAEQLYQQVCEALEEKAIAAKSEGNEGESWVVASRLRDHLLLPRERKNAALWKQVEDLIQEDSRIDQYPKFVKGESRIVLEWQVEGALYSGTLNRDAHHRSVLTEEKSNEPVENLTPAQVEAVGLNN